MPATKRYNAVTDYQGSVLALIDTSGNQAAAYTYSPYGATTAAGPTAAANPLRWLGQFQLKGGVYSLGCRYYNASYERFTAPDPTGQERNAYAYAAGDPANYSDATGVITKACVFTTAGAIIGVVGVGVGAILSDGALLPAIVSLGFSTLGGTVAEIGACSA